MLAFEVLVLCFLFLTTHLSFTLFRDNNPDAPRHLLKTYSLD